MRTRRIETVAWKRDGRRNRRRSPDGTSSRGLVLSGISAFDRLLSATRRIVNPAAKHIAEHRQFTKEYVSISVSMLKAPRATESGC